MKEIGKDEGHKSFFSWVTWVFGTFFFRLMGLNVVFLLCCVPVVTIPAALCGLHAVVQQYYRKKFATAGMTTFFKEFLTAFPKRTILIWGILLIPVAVAVLTGGILPRPAWFSLVGFFLVLTLLVLSWLIPQLVFLNLRTREALKNALLLTCLESKANFFLILINIVSMTILIYGLPVTLFLLLILPVLNVVLTTGITVKVLQTKLVDPK